MWLERLHRCEAYKKRRLPRDKSSREVGGLRSSKGIKKKRVAGGQQSGTWGRPARPWGGLKGRQAGHTDCSTNGRITGIVTPTQPP